MAGKLKAGTSERGWKRNTKTLLDLPLDCVHVHTHCGDLATAVLMEFVATCLTSEAIEKKLVTEITVGQFKEGFPYLRERGHDECTCTATTNMITRPIHRQKPIKVLGSVKHTLARICESLRSVFRREDLQSCAWWAGCHPKPQPEVPLQPGGWCQCPSRSTSSDWGWTHAIRKRKGNAYKLSSFGVYLYCRKLLSPTSINWKNGMCLKSTSPWILLLKMCSLGMNKTAIGIKGTLVRSHQGWNHHIDATVAEKSQM